MNTKDLRELFTTYFQKNGHAIISSASLIPENDPTVLFTTAGMHPLVPYLMGESHPSGARLTDVQKCIRTGDIDEVGDKWHLTFFEMLGNWSLNDYWKKEAIQWSFEFLTNQLNIPINKLAVTVFEGDSDAPFDSEAYELWKNVGMPEESIFKYNKKENWWCPAGQTGPCGPDTEMFYITDVEKCSPECQPSCSCGKYVEIWNDVFMEYFKDKEGKYNKAERHNVDTGMGLERTVAILGSMSDVYQVDTMWPIVEKIEEISGKKYLESDEITKSMRIIADHLRATVMIMGDNRGVGPSNIDQGYVVRKLIRRAIRHGRKLGIEQNFCKEISQVVLNIFGEVYVEIEKNKQVVFDLLEKEEEKFKKTLEQGLKEFAKMSSDNKITGKEAFNLFTTYGFPLEMTQELAIEGGMDFDIREFEEEFKKHQDLSRSGAEQKFKGGLADTSIETTRLHTATHLLHAALRKVLGDHVEQKGSNITAERLRFDFSHPDKMTDEQKKQVEDLVNSAIVNKYPVSFQEMTVDEAKEKGAIGLFEDRYADKVKVYIVGDTNQKPNADANSETFSMEICGGPHVENTKELGEFKIKKEEASSAGIRRIKAILQQKTT